MVVPPSELSVKILVSLPVDDASKNATPSTPFPPKLRHKEKGPTEQKSAAMTGTLKLCGVYYDLVDQD